MMGICAIPSHPVFAQTFDPDEELEWRSLSDEQLVQRACALCHLYPAPALLTRQNWKDEILPRMSVELGVYPPDYRTTSEADLLRARRIYPEIPRIPKELWPRIESYYLTNAPQTPLPQIAHPEITLDLKQFQVQPPRFFQRPATTTLVKISPATHRIFVGDDRAQSLFLLDSNGALMDTVRLGNVPVDIHETASGIYVVCVGSFIPSERYTAELKFVERTGDKFGPVRTLLKELPRSVQADFADLNGDGREDFTLCMYGNRTGRFSWFENLGNDQLVEHLLLDHSGSMFCHIRDFNGDGKPDLAVLLAQELEMLTLYMNDGHGDFSAQIVYQKPPVFGHSWFEPVDFNNDGRLDFLLTNGDNGEYESPTKNYHGIRIVQNEGGQNYREVYFYPLNGAYKALARDFDGDGDLDIAAISYFPDYRKSPRESFVYLRNDGNMKFTAASFPQCIVGRWLVMDAADLDADGDIDIVMGSHTQGPKSVPRFLADQWNKQPIPALILRNVLKAP